MEALDTFSFTSTDDPIVAQVCEWLAVDLEHRRAVWQYDENTKTMNGFVFEEQPVS